MAGKLAGKVAKFLENPIVKQTLEWVVDIMFGPEMQNLIDTLGWTIAGAVLGFVIAGPKGALLLGGVGALLDISRHLAKVQESNTTFEERAFRADSNADYSSIYRDVEHISGKGPIEYLIESLRTAAFANIQVLINGENLTPDSVDVYTRGSAR
jgi:hypothetical protein